jgi:hypothetical protein
MQNVRIAIGPGQVGFPTDSFPCLAHRKAWGHTDKKVNKIFLIHKEIQKVIYEEWLPNI